MLLWRNRTPNMPESNTTQSRSHEWIDQRSLAMGRAIAGNVRAQPALFQIAKDNLKRWIQQRQPDVPIVLQEWQEILTQWPVEKIPKSTRKKGQNLKLIDRAAHLTFRANLQHVLNGKAEVTRNYVRFLPHPRRLTCGSKANNWN